MEISTSQEDALENLTLVGDILGEIISDAVEASEEKLAISLSEFPNGEWIVLDEWNETPENYCVESNEDGRVKKSKYSSSRKSSLKGDKGKISSKKRKISNSEPGNNNPNISNKDFILEDHELKREVIGDDLIRDSVFQKDAEDKFHCETCGRQFDYYDDGIIHIETHHKLSHGNDSAKMLRLPKNSQMLKMFCCSFPDCPNQFSRSSGNILKCHMLTMHEDIGLAKTNVLVFCQLCKGDPFEDENDLDSHLAIVHEVDKEEMNKTKTTPVYYYCIFCRKPIGPKTSWDVHTNALLHRYKKSRFSFADENDNSKDTADNESSENLNLEEAIMMTKREFSASKKEYELKELGKRRQNSKKYAMQKNSIFSRLGPKMVPCTNCPEIIRRDLIEMHINMKHPHASFQCNFFPRHRVRSCGKNFCTAKKTLAHLRSHFPEIRMCEAIDRGLVKIPLDLRWMRCKICGRCYNGQSFQSMVDHVQEDHPKVGSSPANVTDFGCRLCGIISHGVHGYEKLQKHIREKKRKSFIYNNKL